MSVRPREEQDRQTEMATAVQNPMLPLSPQAHRASGVGFLSQPWCRQMLPGYASGRGKGLGLKGGVHAEVFVERKRHLWQAADPGQILHDFKTEMGILISRKENKQTNDVDNNNTTII